MNRQWLPRRLLLQLLLLTTAALLLALTLQAIYTVRQQTVLARASIDLQASALARSLAVSSTDALVLGNLDVLDELLERSVDFPDVLELLISDGEGRILSHFVRQSGQPAKRHFDPPQLRLALPGQAQAALLTQGEGDAERLVAWHPVSGGSLLGWVRVDYSIASLDEIRRSIRTTTVFAAALAILGSSGLLYLFLRRPMRALQQARSFAISLKHANGAQLPLLAAPVEIEDLVKALNTASLNLHRQRQELDAYIGRLRANEAVIRDRTEQLDAIFVLSPDGFVSFDHERRVKYVNPAFLRMTGASEASLVGLAEAQFSAWLAERCAAAAAFPGMAALHALPPRGGAPVTSAASVSPAMSVTPARPLLIELAEPQRLVLELRLRLSQAETVAQILYCRDVTHETAVDRMKSEFLSTAAHELRTPMASIYGFAELLLNREFPEEERQEFLKIIYTQTGLMTGIINELLDLARIEARRGKDFDLTAVELGELLREVIRAYRLPPGHMPPLMSGAGGMRWVRADRGKLIQAVSNVLSNAYKYSPQGGQIEIALLDAAVAGVAPQVGIRIRDHGIGMAPEQLARVCERFYRADAAGTISGTGLGMSIVKEIIDLLGGRLELNSTQGDGTEVTLWLPAALPDEATEAGDAA